MDVDVSRWNGDIRAILFVSFGVCLGGWRQRCDLWSLAAGSVSGSLLGQSQRSPLQRRLDAIYQHGCMLHIQPRLV